MGRQISEDITQLLFKWREGDASALDKLIPLVYNELHRLAHLYLRRERSDHSMQTTALVHEAYLRLTKASQVEWHDRVHFFAIAAQLMRQVLVDEARKRGFKKRAGQCVPLDEAALVCLDPDQNLINLDAALNDLAKYSPIKSRIVELRFFGGLSIAETSRVMGISTDLVKREWRTSKLWLLRELNRAGDGNHEPGEVAPD